MMLYSYLLMRNLNQSAKALVFINFNTVSLTATGFLVPYSAAVGVLPPGGAFSCLIAHARQIARTGRIGDVYRRVSISSIAAIPLTGFHAVPIKEIFIESSDVFRRFEIYRISASVDLFNQELRAGRLIARNSDGDPAFLPFYL